MVFYVVFEKWIDKYILVVCIIFYIYLKLILPDITSES